MTYPNEQAPAIYYQCQPEAAEVLQYLDLKGFSVADELDRLTGSPTLEIAGPTYSGFPTIANRVPSDPYVSNIFPCSTNSEVTDLLADFRALPIKSGTIGMVLASCMPLTEMPNKDGLNDREVREQAFAVYSTYFALGGEVSKRLREKNQRISVIEESARILMSEGLLVWQGGLAGDIDVAEMNGLDLVRYGNKTRSIEYEDGVEAAYESHQCVFQKR